MCARDSRALDLVEINSHRSGDLCTISRTWGDTIVFQILGLYKMHRDVPIARGLMLHECYLELQKQE